MYSRKISISLALGSCLLLMVTSCKETAPKEVSKEHYKTWSSYLGDSGRNHFTTLSQITPKNVQDLKVAWTYEAQDWGQMQMNPLVLDSMVYGVTAALRVVALHAGTGKEIWQYGDSVKVWHSTSRGLSYWKKDKDQRILCTRGSDLIALNALTGEPISTFGINGKVDMRKGLPEREQSKFLISNTPGTVFNDLIIMPLRVSEGAGAALGDVMAFNVVTGKHEWSFKTIPDAGKEGSETWGNTRIRESEIVGAANNWSGMAVDEELEIIYVPTGSAAPDFYGGVRPGSNLFANSLVALNANTGEKVWHFQFTHHDIWDRDPPAPPNLITVERNGEKIPAVAQVTKQGYVFVFDRRTGEPLFEIEERPVPTSTLKGEKTSPTQPFPVNPKPFARQSNSLTEDDMSPFSENKEELLAVFKKADKRIYAPPSLDPVLLLPGYDGAAEWGGAGADPDKGILYVNSNEMPYLLKMGEAKNMASGLPKGQAIYQQNCATCHNPDRSGAPASGFPSLIDLQFRKEKDEVTFIITQGKGMMTGFPQIKGDDMEALLRFLYDQEIQHSVEEEIVKKDSLPPVPYKHLGYNKFLDSKGLPAIAPPWGTLHAIDLNSGDFLWSVPFGNTPELGEEGIGTGTESYGGPIVTENGLLLIAGTRDGFFRAFDRHTGKILWEYQLPAPAFATPATYEFEGKQYIVLACGGEKLGTPKGNKIMAFALE
ncbi:outer membrane protein assembly factor BamB family protein [Euzebyella saccharophila]|uniref:PQQ-binding-like beta-propeller repeat protein n=1 Tax=Euzebyella saccharophila TaxID=679664 RepID=A0ABV8JQ44_9FLAO|nr:PQQ-binding-like beta-propeller repeat protein [Euzebyella saccharophila]